MTGSSESAAGPSPKSLIQALSAMGVRLDASLQLLSAISSLTAVPVNSKDLSEASREILGILLRELNDVSACSMLLHDRASDRLVLLAARGQADLLGEVEGPYNLGLSFKPGEGAAGLVFTENQPFYWHKGAPETDVLKVAPDLGTPEALASLPLSTSDRCLGVLNVSFGAPTPFDSGRRRDLALLGGVTANIVQSFLLKTELDDKAASLSVARDELEQRVAERTAELTAATEELRQEVAERKRAAEALMESEGRYRLLAENIQDVIWSINLETMGYTYVSPSFDRLTGYGVEEAAHLRLADLLTPESYRLAVRAIKDGLAAADAGDAAGHAQTVELEQRHKDGRTLWVGATISILRDDQGRPKGVIGVSRDITQRKQAELERARLEDQLRQTQRLEAIGTLAGGIAHDFNNILSAVIGYTQLVQRKLPKDSQERTNIDQVLIASRRARDLIKQILTFSRQSPVQKRPLLLSPIVKEVTKLIRASLPSTTEIHFNPIAEDSAVLADPSQIHQVVMNLTTNAGQAMGEKGGRITITLDDVDIEAEAPGTPPGLSAGLYARLTVADTGPGMTRAVMERIFEPYFTTKAQDEGTGLGLAVVHGIVKNHGGAIAVASEPGQGSRFEVFLPGIKPDESSESVEPRELAGGSERILLVDDEKPVVDFLRQFLSELGYDVSARTCSVEALEAFKVQPDKYDLIVTDQTMPRMSGLELAKRVREIRADMPVIVCTGFGEKIGPERVKAAGVAAVVMKPLLADEIAATVRGVLDKSAG